MQANFIAVISTKTISENKSGVIGNDYFPKRSIEGNGVYFSGRLVSRFFATWNEAAEFLKTV